MFDPTKPVPSSPGAAMSTEPRTTRATRETTNENLADRLRGRYVLPVDDGAGLLNGSDVFEQTYEVGAISKRAADRIEELESELTALRSQIPAWLPGGARGGELPDDLVTGTPLLAWASLDGHPVAVKFGRDETGYWFSSLPGIHCDIEWEDIDRYLPLSQFPLPPYSEVEKMTYKELKTLFKSNIGDDEYGEFERIEHKLSQRADLHAFMLLDQLVPCNRDIVAGASHDEIYLDVEPEDLARAATAEQVIDLIRCGIRLTSDNGLAMFA